MTLLVACSGGGPGNGQGQSQSSASGSTPGAECGGSIASAATDQLGAKACNSSGGGNFGTSCSDGKAQLWCADFAKSIWQAQGANVSGLTPGAGSFYNYGVNNGTFSTTPHVGDAILLGLNKSTGYASHVGIVTAVNPDGTITTVDGDYGGTSGNFANTSSVKQDGPFPSTVGTSSGWTGGKTIGGYVSPAGGTMSGSGGAMGSGTGGGSSPCSAAPSCKRKGSGSGTTPQDLGGGGCDDTDGGTEAGEAGEGGNGEAGEGGDNEGGSSEAGSNEGGGGEGGVGEGGQDMEGGGYAFVEPRAHGRHHAFSLAEGAPRTTIRLAWHAAPGVDAPADLSVEAGGREALQIASVGDHAFVRAGLDMVPLDSDSPYDLTLERAGDSVQVVLSRPTGEVVVRANVTIGEATAEVPAIADVVLADRLWRGAIVSDQLP